MLQDSYGRSFKYLRLSLTEKCNFKCSYCLPDGYKGCGQQEFLSLAEIKNLATAFSELGVEKIRLTGGEPTLRSDLIEIISLLKNEIGIQHVALTTNAFRLEKIAPQLKHAGLDAINISLDSLKKETFQNVCGVNSFDSILRSVDQCVDLGFSKVKINSVLLRGINSQDFADFIRYVQQRPISVRFIELMRTSDNVEYFKKHHMSVGELEKSLIEMGWQQNRHSEIGGPAREFSHSDYQGRIGFIAPYSKDFCQSCNRLRISSTGGLRLCLFGEGDLKLRELLQTPQDKAELKLKIMQALHIKPEAHRLHEDLSGNTKTFSAIGG